MAMRAAGVLGRAAGSRDPFGVPRWMVGERSCVPGRRVPSEASRSILRVVGRPSTTHPDCPSVERSESAGVRWRYGLARRRVLRVRRRRVSPVRPETFVGAEGGTAVRVGWSPQAMAGSRDSRCRWRGRVSRGGASAAKVSRMVGRQSATCARCPAGGSIVTGRGPLAGHGGCRTDRPRPRCNRGRSSRSGTGAADDRQQIS